MHSLSEMIFFDSSLEKEIKGKFDSKGELADGASPKLRKIRKEQHNAGNGIRRSLRKIFAQATQDGIVPENSQPTFRDGRFVIPILASHKKQLKGFVHDESASGQTIYLEPTEVLETNNKIVELHHEEKRECVRIFIALTASIRDNLGGVIKAFEYLSVMDFIHAKGELGKILNGTIAVVSSEDQRSWFKLP